MAAWIGRVQELAWPRLGVLDRGGGRRPAPRFLGGQLGPAMRLAAAERRPTYRNRQAAYPVAHPRQACPTYRNQQVVLAEVCSLSFPAPIRLFNVGCALVGACFWGRTWRLIECWLPLHPRFVLLHQCLALGPQQGLVGGDYAIDLLGTLRFGESSFYLRDFLIGCTGGFQCRCHFASKRCACSVKTGRGGIARFL